MAAVSSSSNPYSPYSSNPYPIGTQEWMDYETQQMMKRSMSPSFSASGLSGLVASLGSPSPTSTGTAPTKDNGKDDKQKLGDAWDSLEIGDVIRTSYQAREYGYIYVEGEIETKNSERIKLINIKRYTTETANTSADSWAIYKQNTSWVINLSQSRKTAKAAVTIDKVILSEDKKEQIMAAISQVEHNDKIFSEWGFGQVFEKGTAVSLLFYGVPGTGKTLMAEAIANHLKQKIKIIQTADVESSEPGQAERNLREFFKLSGTVLLFDECDSLIAPRDEVGMILGAQINALLTELERYTGTVIFTTNRLGRMDAAFERRVSAKIEFTFPTKEQREQIWKNLIPKEAPIHKEVKFSKLAEIPLPGGHIKNAVLNAARRAAYLKREIIDLDCFTHGIQKELEAADSFEEARNDQPKIPQERGMSTNGGGLEIHNTRTMSQGASNV